MRKVILRGLIGLAAFLAAWQWQTAQAATTPVPVQSCANGALSGNVGHLALVSVQNKQQSIALANADGSGRACLASLASTAQAQVPAWSPDGAHLAFVLAYSPDGGLSSAFTLYVVDADGSNPHAVSPSVGGLSYSWSPDSQHLVYSVQGLLAVTDLNGAATPLLKNGEKGDFSPAWSPDGKMIAYSRNDGIYAVNADGSNARNVSNAAHANLPDSADQYPFWSPNSQQIAFRSTRDSSEQVYVVNVDGSALKRVSDPSMRSALDRMITWSPDGGQLAFAAHPQQGNMPGHIVVVKVDGSGLHRLTTTTM